jgi:hypothetical protein
MMKKGLTLVLSDEELLDLCRILMDRDEAGALAFLDQHLKKQVRRVLEGG